MYIQDGNWYLYGLAVLKLWIKSGQSRNCPTWDSLMLNYSLQKPDFTVTSHNTYLRYLYNGKLILNVDKQFVAFFVKKDVFLWSVNFYKSLNEIETQSTVSPPKIWHESSFDLEDIKINFVSVNYLRVFLNLTTNLDYF